MDGGMIWDCPRVLSCGVWMAPSDLYIYMYMSICQYRSTAKIPYLIYHENFLLYRDQLINYLVDCESFKSHLLCVRPRVLYIKACYINHHGGTDSRASLKSPKFDNSDPQTSRHSIVTSSTYNVSNFLGTSWVIYQEVPNTSDKKFVK